MTGQTISTFLAFSIGSQAATTKQSSAEKKAEKEKIALQKAEEATIPIQDSYLEMQVAIHDEILTQTRAMILQTGLAEIERESYGKYLQTLGYSDRRDSANKREIATFKSTCEQAENQRRQAEQKLGNLRLDALKAFNGKWPERLSIAWEVNAQQLVTNITETGGKAMLIGPKLEIFVACRIF